MAETSEPTTEPTDADPADVHATGADATGAEPTEADPTDADPTLDESGGAQSPARPIVAGAGGEHRVKRYLLAVLMAGVGVWFVYDGFVGWPRANAEAVRKQPGIDPEKVPHPGWDVPINRMIGLTLVPLAGGILWWAWYASRGTVSLDEADVLRVPGHPPVPLSAVTAVDRSRWDRKGIALVRYALPDGTAGRLKLDDFLYQRQPTDDIYDAVMASIEPPVEQPIEQLVEQPTEQPVVDPVP